MPQAAPLLLAAAPTAFAGTATGTFLATTFGKLLLTVAATALAVALQPSLKVAKTGLRTEKTQTGGTNPQSFVLGTYATAGNAAAPAATHSRPFTKRNNKWLTYVIDVGNIARHQLSRLIINGEYVDLAADGGEGTGRAVLGKFNSHAWIRWHDGTQTLADAQMLESYPPVTPPLAHPAEFPWFADMVGTNVPYAVLIFEFERKLFSGFPEVRFEVIGLPLYDPRKDSTVGGSGTHRWEDTSTHEPSGNPMVQAYNIARGIRLPGAFVWGGNYRADQLPLDSWFAAMNECDIQMERADGTFEPQFRAGIEVRVDDEPRDVLREIGKAASAEFAESGGRLLVRVGPPALPVWFFTDEDVVIWEESRSTPFPDPGEVYNGVAATYVEPESVWESRSAPVLLRPDLEAQDEGQRRVAEINLPTVTSVTQVQRLQRAWIEDNRRFRRHSLTVPPDAMALEPLDVVAWTSDRFGYDTKSFEIAATDRSLRTGLTELALQEKDPADFTHNPADELPTSAPAGTSPVQPTQTIDSFQVAAIVEVDEFGANRRPGVELSWDADLGDERGLIWRARLSGTTAVILSGSTVDFGAGALRIFEGILPNTSYEFQAEPITDRPVAATLWLGVMTADARLGETDLDATVRQKLDLAVAASQAAIDADAKAQGVRDDHDALVVGFTGALGSAFSAVDSDITALQASVGDNAAAITTEATARANADGVLAADITALDGAVGTLSADITDILGLTVSGTEAFGVLMTQLAVDSGGTSATISQQGTAIADLEGNASAAQVFRAKAGSQGAVLELLAWDDADGGGASVARIRADDILLEGTVGFNQLVGVNLTGNMVPNGAFNQGDFRGWTGVPSTFSIVERASGSAEPAIQNIPTRYAVQMSQDAAAQLVINPLPDAVKVGDQIAFSFAHGSVAGSAGVIAIRIRFFDPTGIESGTVLSGDFPAAGTGWTVSTLSGTVPAGAVSMRLDVSRLAGGGGDVFATDFEIIRRRPGSVLITPDSITAASGILADAVISTAKMQDAAITNAKIGDLQVNTLKLAGESVSIMRQVNGGSSATLVFTPAFDGAITVLSGITIQAVFQEPQGNTPGGNLQLKRNGSIVRTAEAFTEGFAFISVTTVAGVQETWRVDGSAGSLPSNARLVILERFK